MPLDYYSQADKNALSALKDVMLALTSSESLQASYRQHAMAAAAVLSTRDVPQI